MWKIFKPKNKETKQTLSDHEKQERSVIRQSSYEDDWMLNIEPVLEGDEEADEEAKKLIEENHGNSSKVETKSVSKSKVTEGPLSSIISGAKKTNEANIAEVIEGSDTHRKMALIEKIRREGGEMPEDVFTDLSKSSFGSEYKNRANSISSTYKPMSIEEQIEQRRLLSEQKANSRKLTIPQPEVKNDIATEIQKRKELSQKVLEQRKPSNEEDKIENEKVETID
ncbi:hypothetical protein STIUS_v1c05560 [Spiroplasma sp. TIUS-1]|uniref:hypothetical protein n=1 Tax=Spiroplasma sp. TIUS-1 TaxID=216963 RepID=UPI001398D972|nr:hypothetical protein [Spiroplasma sp. TIUS-1]QHX36110.1 hypothetical protein STIUS_v1c05560 [Spiroplasma sp. TIUS-1]